MTTPLWVECYGLTEPYGKCQCGRGEDAPLAKYSDNRRMTLKGQPQRFINRHAARLQPSNSKYADLDQAFAAQVKQGNSDECWDARGVMDNGYGRINFKGKQYYAPRTSYELYRGEIPDDMLVCHTCDRRCCANPDHLFLGDNQDNMTDMVKKGRQAKGEKHGQYKTGRNVGRPTMSHGERIRRYKKVNRE